MSLSTTTYNKGFLLTADSLGGVSEHPEIQNSFFAYVISLETSELMTCFSSPELEKAVDWINQQKTDWNFSTTKDCGSEECGTTCGDDGCETTCEHPCK